MTIVPRGHQMAAGAMLHRVPSRRVFRPLRGIVGHALEAWHAEAALVKWSLAVIIAEGQISELATASYTQNLPRPL